jgi:hypothetical protein
MSDQAIHVALRLMTLGLFVVIVIVAVAMVVEGRRNRRRTKRNDVWFGGEK